MKKIFNIVLIMIACFAFSGEVNAAEFVISRVVDNTTIVKGNEVSIKINLKASEAIKECLFKFENR